MRIEYEDGALDRVRVNQPNGECIPTDVVWDLERFSIF
jgi:hypothetical protein